MIPKELVLSVLLPVRNEQTSISLIVKILSALIDVPHELLVITDHANDPTIPVLTTLMSQYNEVRHIENTSGKGVLNAVRAGVRAAQGTYILIYAADELGPALSISNMLNLMDRGCDFVSGTRYSKGGKRYGGSKIGYFLSKTANLLFNLVSATALTDCTTGLKMFRKSLFELFDLSSTGAGWSFAFDMSIAAQVMGFKCGEVPIVSIDRLFGGKSTMHLSSWILSYIRCFLKGVSALPPWYTPKPKLESFLSET